MIMDLSPLLDHIRSLSAYQNLQERLEQKDLLPESLGLARAVRPPFVSALAADLQRPILLVLFRNDRLLTFQEELPIWESDLPIEIFEDPTASYYEVSPWSARAKRRRVQTLAALTLGAQPETHGGTAASPPLVLTSTRALMSRTLSSSAFLQATRWLEVGRAYDYEDLVRFLLDDGYAHSSLVTKPGQFSRRGGILDIWPPSEDAPSRIEFFGDHIDSLRFFHPGSQRSTAQLSNLRIVPAREGLPHLFREDWLSGFKHPFLEEGEELKDYFETFLPCMSPHPTGIIDFLPEDALVLLEDQTAFESAVAEIETRALSSREEMIRSGTLPDTFSRPYLTLEEVQESLRDHQVLDLGITSDFQEENSLSDAFTAGPRFGGQLRPLIEHVVDRILHHETTIIVSRQAHRLTEVWEQEDTPKEVREQLPQDMLPGEVLFLQGALSGGWTLQSGQNSPIHLLTDAEIFGWARPRPRRRPRREAKPPESAYADLQQGDLVVHVDHGIGRFQGLVERRLDELTREFLLVEYAGGGQLYVPIHQADRITRYVGVGGAQPELSRLGTQSWERAKHRVREEVEEVARELLVLYARRQTIQGYAYSPDKPWQRELEASFPYQETEDQIRALKAIKRDMERPQPMDRLICGDSGYGKTEVALRAAFKAVLDGRQVAMLVPTTVLAQQHFHTFQERLAAFPVEVEMLSRFRTRSEAERILRRLASGAIDIVIGTHRLLQDDVEFDDLGLLIIDEEQRFGVTHKEHFKMMRTSVDVLTLTATPIPRTLYMALTGARDISTINTPPEERLPVTTMVGPYNPHKVRQAVLRELDRDGQTFFVHNRVQTIDTMRRRLERLIPEARIAVAHGQMPERDLAQVMERFTDGDIDVLVCTSIVESGLDIPNANTLIVDRADRFGLAQLYQLRGRVGRAAAQGYAYFFRHASSKTTEEGLHRLEVIAEHDQLGAGYSIAMRDLELRGAGDILGTRQHGHIAAVGFHLYTRLLAEAVRSVRQKLDQESEELPETPMLSTFLPATVELPLASAIPESYISDRSLRLQLYRRMAEIRRMDQLQAMQNEMVDRFGSFPPEVDNLFYQLEVRLRAAAAGVRSITVENGQLLLHIPEERAIRNLRSLDDEIRRSKRGLWLRRDPARKWTRRLLDVLHELDLAEEHQRSRS